MDLAAWVDYGDFHSGFIAMKRNTNLKPNIYFFDLKL